MPVWGNVNPSTRIELYTGVPFDRNYTNVVRFTNEADQKGYFYNHLTGYYTGSFAPAYNSNTLNGRTGTILYNSYLNPDGSWIRERPRYTVKVNAVAEQLYKCNYMGWTNNPAQQELNPQNFDEDSTCPEQWYYAFITNIYHEANNVSVIEFELDYWQTYHLRITPLQCFVERESPESDEPFEHLEPEELEPSIYKISNNTTYTPSTMGVPCIVIEGVPTTDQGIGDNSGFYGFIYNGANIYTYPILSEWSTVEEQLKSFINSFQNSGGTINRIYMCYGTPQKTSESPINNPVVFSTEISKITNNLDGYYFRNNKLNIFPYRRITMLMPDKTKISILPQLVNSNEIDLLIGTIMGNPPTLIASPANYDSITDKFALPYIMSYSQVTECSFTTDVYRQYLAQNINNITANTLLSLFSVGLSSATSFTNSASPSTASLSSQSSNIVNNSINAYGGSIPDKLSGRITNSLQIPLQQNGVTLLYETPTSVEAKQIDEYFHAFGYNCSKTKVPNLTHGHWSYIKTSNFMCNSDGVSGNGLSAITDMFNNGVRIWNYRGTNGKDFDNNYFCKYSDAEGNLIDRQPEVVYN